MAFLHINHPLAFIFGMCGNLSSFLVYLAPLPTFYRVYRKKSTEGFQSIPYVVALFSAMLWIYYATVKGNTVLLITINSFGCFIELIYISMYIHYAPRKEKIFTAKMMFLVNILLFGLIVVSTMLFTKGEGRATVLGWICVAFAVSVFVAPLSIMKRVIQTKSVEFMPFYLSLFLTLSALSWFAYGLVKLDKYVALPNVLGFLFGMAQMILYMIYKGEKKIIQEEKLADHIVSIIIPEGEGQGEATVKGKPDDNNNNMGRNVTQEEVEMSQNAV
ncbi:bidirectional sugar transporter SWEET13-like [Dioscorea cayenensis subsp. rotundata]|uniref:Bidirectional sugar transporter SWEET n=1 Tax=Dioscorea cayennensis subsp. rotundata TaxID=55577 RepID=A0AB40AYP4_DIOCR|nr:bidirectional sugar transporter SWEET13-like [Dioscorea cayenensis subsp. rotundata]